MRYYVMGAVGEADAPGNVWREAADWPPASTPTPLYLREDGKLSTDLPTAETGSTSYKSDPLHPMEIPGTSFPGAKDARPFEKQAEVRTFTTEPLATPVEWTGRVRAELFVSSTAKDTDFIVRVSDVYPDGRSILIVDYPVRARYRDGFDKEVLMEPGKVYTVAYRRRLDEPGVQRRAPHPGDGGEHRGPAVRAEPADRQAIDDRVPEGRGRGDEHDPPRPRARLPHPGPGGDREMMAPEVRA